MTEEKAETTLENPKEAPKKETEMSEPAKKTSKPSKVVVQELEQSTSRMQMRLQSYGYSAISSFRKHDLTSSAIGIEYKRPALIYQPTFQMEPLTRFKCSKVENLINRILDSVYNNHIYHVQTSPVLAVSIADIVMKETKYMHFNRYRVICVVVIGEKRSQSYNNAVSFLWDDLRDTYVDMERESYSSFIQITVFGIYLD